MNERSECDGSEYPLTGFGSFVILKNYIPLEQMYCYSNKQYTFFYTLLLFCR